MIPLSRRELLALLPGALFAQPPQQVPTYSADVKVVNVLATVRNKKGEIVKDLRKEDFLLEEDGRPQSIRYFSRETDLPLTLGLLVDTSLSQRRVLGAEQKASYRFLEQVLREDQDMAFVIHFDFEVELLADLTSSRKKLEQALEQLRPPDREQLQRRQPGDPGSRGPRRGGGGGTMLFDSVLLASDELMRLQKGRKALIMLSDGVDTGSKVSIAAAIESAQRSDTMVYSILFADEQAYPAGPPAGWGGRGGRRGGGGRMPPQRVPVNRPDGKKILERLARETGGGFFEVSKKHPIEKVYDLIEAELRSQYSIGYSSDRKGADLTFRKIYLRAKQKDLIVQTRDGYYPAG